MSESKNLEGQLEGWVQYRDAAILDHAVSTEGAASFANIVMVMLMSGIPVTQESFDAEVHDYMRLAHESKDLERYYRAMIAHAFFSRTLFEATGK